ncbi:MAG: dihydroorotase [Candidatus Lambdaproteobacteria bacterium RIFOXYD1_FULL_56_27]|uniref:Dihydroorotase n=1 Tax=Candidatus Lambdaproteobacteria bacterium RIFOXYD2_FULL_56_26 TaxID=1817773 RepID=A0A1F6H2W5_9PROT|nr:MAG: dihydroorotase [Candidatus Lambdaproteobacteria bacterium RIFOXYD2_FULL_56_26]OGH05360.1 MAG: dihydroorotase [Candidatus Lambdaproteobacteria bacterium RIFOXYC1_FULL_56_13]OGH09202.1 MAG: dihydroorotase [Candidatus Lambdaproteobacteria bacterium RIFOXYD1_FULL_56_27]
MIQRIELNGPDDFHLHLRQGEQMAAVVLDAAKNSARALVMPNLKIPIRTTAEALAYKDAIVTQVPGTGFEPLMSLYLTDETPKEEVRVAKESGAIVAFKLYPQGATTHSSFGVTNLKGRYGVFEAMEKEGLVLCLHGEVTDPKVDIFDREKVFVDRLLAPLAQAFPGLKMVLEHVTTQEGVDFVVGGGANLAGTLTAHHLWINRNDLLVGGIKPHHYCLPVAKREEHRLALVKAATSGNPKFFLGSDSAPHSVGAKECASGCAGIYTGRHLLAYYAMAFEQAGKLEALADFAGKFGAQFYGLPVSDQKRVLVKKPESVPLDLDYGTEKLVPFRAGETLTWTLEA